MRGLLRGVALVHVALLLPAALFLTSVLVGTGEPPQHDLADIAHRIVAWYAGRGWTLWLLLLALPLTALLTGCATLIRTWSGESDQAPARPSLSMIPAPIATLTLAATTMMAATVLGVVILHMLAN